MRSFPDKRFQAKLIRKAGSIDNETRSEIWEFQVPNSDGALKPGGNADIKLRFMRIERSKVVPVSAVVTTLERKFVIKVVDHITQWIDVRPGFNMGDKQEVFGEIKAGDTIVLKANEELKAGVKIAVK
jgi:hypothetical protein